MRPISVKMSAFGPYAGKVEIPMQDLGTEGLYLITGDTGSGKTTIFDAICYALFGEASGDNRDSSMFRSKYAELETPTEVELVFEHAGKEYTVKRNPEYERPAKRGDGTTVQRPNAELYLPDGNVVTKIQDVNNSIKDILAVDCNQFTQIVMLAQGNFSKLLFANTDDRKKIFREIFKTLPYQKLEKRLYEHKKEVESESERLNDSIKQYVNGIQVDEEDELSIDVEKAISGEMMTEDVIALLEKINEKDEKKKEKLDKDIADNDKVLEEIIANVNTAQNIKEIKENLANAEERLKEENPKLDAFKETLDKAKASSKDEDKFNKEAAQIEKELVNYDAVEELTKEIESLSEEKEDKTEEKKELKEKLNESQKALEDLKKEQNELKDSKTELEKQKTNLEKAQKSINELDELNVLFSNIDTEKTKLEKYQKDYDKADKEFNKVNAEYEKLEQLFRDGQAGVLASKLEEGEQCPVCGSTEHPSLAKLSDEIPTQEELDSSKVKADEARDKREEAAKRASGSQEKIKALEEELKKQLNKHIDYDDMDEGMSKIDDTISSARAEVDKISEQLEETEAKVERKETLDEQIPEMEKEIDEIKAGDNKLNEDLTRITSTVDEKKKQLDEKKKSLKFEDKSTAEEKMNELLEKVKELRSAEEKAEEDFNAQNTLITKIETEIKEHKKSVESAKDIDLEAELEKQDKYNSVKEELRELDNNLVARLQSNQSTYDILKQKSSDAIEVESKLQWIDVLSKTANGQLRGKEKVALETYVQSTYFDRIIRKANIRFMEMSSGQYELNRMKEASSKSGQTGLELSIIDHYNGSERSVKSLSGGESFMAALSLALGLSDEVQSSAGGIQIDTMFVDEGFGSLDPNSLDQAFRALTNLSDGNKLVGIISHVEGLKDRIDKQIVVTKDKVGGSHVKMNV